MKGKCFILALIFLVAGQVNAQQNFNISSVNQYYHNWQDGVYDVCIQGDYAYLSCNNDGLRIVNIANPAMVTEVGHFMPSDVDEVFASAVAVSGNYVYMDFSNVGILIIDISNPGQPQEISRIPIAYGVGMIRIDGAYAYACGYGWKVISISDPANPEIIWESGGFSDITDIDLRGDTAFVAAGEGGLQLFDISQPASPVMLDSFSESSGHWAGSVSVAGHYAFLAYGSAGFLAVDLNTMEEVARIDSLVYAFSIEVRDFYAYMTYGNPECPLAVIDISDPISPRTVGIYNPPEDIVRFALDGDLAYCADFYHGLRMISVAEPSNPHEEYIYSRFGHDYQVSVNSQHAIVREEYKLKTIDIANLHNPAELGYYEFWNRITDMAIVGNIAYTCHFAPTCLNAIDLTDPSSPALAGSFTTASDVHCKVDVYDHYAYILEYSGIRIVDITDPAAMTEVGYHNAQYSSFFLEIFDHYAVVENTNGLVIVLDLSDPLALHSVGSYGSGQGVRGLKQVGDRLYLIGQHWLWIYDISDRENWSLVSTTTVPGDYNTYLTGLDVVGGAAYLAVSPTGLYVYDITGESNPQVIGFFDTPGHPCGVTVMGDLAVVADFDNLGFYDCSQAVGVDEPSQPQAPAEFALMPNYPNPFNPSTVISFSLPTGNEVNLNVYDLLGRHVATLVSGTMPAGSHSVTWNGKDDSGQDAASGVYIYKLDSSGARATQRMTLVR